jgi:REP element-mobilizing transposase RayT
VLDLFPMLPLIFINSCTLPSDHEPFPIHLLIQGANIINFIRLLKGKLTPIARSKEARKKLWQRSFFDHAIRKEGSLHGIAGYIWENPTRAKIIDEPTS